MKNTASEVLDVKALAKFLKISVRAVYYLRARREIPQGKKVGDSIRWLKSDIENFLKESGDK